jgi:hypothetical protein
MRSLDRVEYFSMRMGIAVIAGRIGIWDALGDPMRGMEAATLRGDGEAGRVLVSARSAGVRVRRGGGERDAGVSRVRGEMTLEPGVAWVVDGV